ncbi:MAG: 3,4-dihydroxy-2-butanone-4-phosphate synthase [Thermoplasmata archaeon]|nr:3,4-dihydroxy-2-butanone-4-phosphate synthase [Thermoplasmata archaeon]
MRAAVRGALKALRRGHPILLYDADGREEETDLVLPSEFVTSEAIRSMRQEAGGLLCTTLPGPVAKRLGLPLMEDALASLQGDFPVIEGLLRHRPAYDARSAFSLTVNHKATRTGITDRDRARTVGALAEVCRYALTTEDGLAQEAFIQEFRTPGHVHLLIAADPLLRERRGHTELSTALLLMGGLLPTATLCEMLADGGGALSKGEANNYATARHLPFVEGSDVLEAWGAWSGSWRRESSTSST